jgi:hypothetical protein
MTNYHTTKDTKDAKEKKDTAKTHRREEKDVASLRFKSCLGLFVSFVGRSREEERAC